MDNFKTPDELGISQKEYISILEVLKEFEDGEIVYDPSLVTQPKGFNFATVAQRHQRGVCACIVGWAKLLGGNSDFEAQVEKLAFDPVRKLLPINNKLADLLDLFFGPQDRNWEISAPTTQDAARAIRNYLTTGKPDWNKVMGHSQ